MTSPNSQQRRSPHVTTEFFIRTVLFFFLSQLVANVSHAETSERVAEIATYVDAMLRATATNDLSSIYSATSNVINLEKPERGNRAEARRLNIMGLAAFNNHEYSDAASILYEAARMDPGDVEIQANLGMALIDSSRFQEAKEPLLVAININPKRTSTWIPLAHYYFQSEDLSKATAALLLAYEFSSNRPKTLSYFDEKSKSQETVSTIYKAAFQEIYHRNNQAPLITNSAVQGVENTETRAVSKEGNSNSEAKENSFVLFPVVVAGLLAIFFVWPYFWRAAAGTITFGLIGAMLGSTGAVVGALMGFFGGLTWALKRRTERRTNRSSRAAIQKSNTHEDRLERKTRAEQLILSSGDPRAIELLTLARANPSDYNLILSGGAQKGNKTLTSAMEVMSGVIAGNIISDAILKSYFFGNETESDEIESTDIISVGDIAPGSEIDDNSGDDTTF